MTSSRLSITVMAHPAREAAARELASRVAAGVAWDVGGGEWDTGARAWAAHDPAASHHLVLQDDAVPCLDLPAAVEAALSRPPAGDLLSLYFGWAEAGAGRPNGHALVSKAAAEADRQHAAWVICPGAWWGVALAAPVNAIGSMLDWCAGRPEPYDMRIARWCQQAGRDVWHTWPSLVDHTDGPSLVRPSRAPGRRAWKFIGVDQSALTGFDPAGPVVYTGSNRRRRSAPPTAGLHDPHGRRSQLQQYLRRRGGQ